MELIKLAYRKIESRTTVTGAEIRKFIEGLPAEAAALQQVTP
jgi:hypothetical protein